VEEIKFVLQVILLRVNDGGKYICSTELGNREFVLLIENIYAENAPI
jgi:hypothetical protein